MMYSSKDSKRDRLKVMVLSFQNSTHNIQDIDHIMFEGSILIYIEQDIGYE